MGQKWRTVALVQKGRKLILLIRTDFLAPVTAVVRMGLLCGFSNRLHVVDVHALLFDPGGRTAQRASGGLEVG